MREALNASGSISPAPTDPRRAPTGERVRAACAFCLQRRNLRRTLRIALVVGVVLTLINQGAVILSGDATAGTWVRCALNFIVPFVVSNAGLLGGRRE